VEERRNEGTWLCAEYDLPYSQAFMSTPLLGLMNDWFWDRRGSLESLKKPAGAMMPVLLHPLPDRDPVVELLLSRPVWMSNRQRSLPAMVHARNCRSKLTTMFVPELTVLDNTQVRRTSSPFGHVRFQGLPLARPDPQLRSHHEDPASCVILDS
jgi:hypothetical protein